MSDDTLTLLNAQKGLIELRMQLKHPKIDTELGIETEFIRSSQKASDICRYTCICSLLV